MRIVFALSLSLLSTGSLAAEAAGVPVQPIPGRLPAAWLEWWNDAVGWTGRNDDDFRSQQLSLYGRSRPLTRWLPEGSYDPEFLGGIDHSILTKRGPQRDLPDPGQEGRLDQLTVTLGVVHLLQQWEDERVEDTPIANHFAVGVSLRLHGDYRGDLLQNNWHEVIQSPPVDLPFTDTERTDLGIWFSGGFTRRFLLRHASRNVFDSFGYWTTLAAQANTAEQIEIGSRAAVFVDGRWWSLWGGLRLEARSGYDDDQVLSAVADNEDGLYGIFGVRAGSAFLFESGMNFHTRGRYGRVGWVARPSFPLWGRPIDSDAKRHDLAGRVGSLMPDFSFLAQLRYSRPQWYWKNLEPGLVLEGRSGQSPDDDPPEHSFAGDQVILGLDLEYAAKTGWRQYLRPYLMLGGGWRQEYLRNTDGDRLDASTEEAWIVQADLGLRIGVQPPSGFGTRLVVGLSAWQTLEDDAVLAIAGRSYRYLTDSLAGLLAFEIRARW